MNAERLKFLYGSVWKPSMTFLWNTNLLFQIKKIKKGVPPGEDRFFSVLISSKMSHQSEVMKFPNSEKISAEFGQNFSTAGWWRHSDGTHGAINKIFFV